MAQKAMQSVDLNAEEKSWHKLHIKNVDITTKYHVGMVYGASGSGKSTIARHIFGDEAIASVKIDPTKAVIDQFPEEMPYDERQRILNSIGLSQIPCWIKPLGLLSNGQQERAKIALNLSVEKELYVFDEWTSVVDRNVARVMSHSVQKFARKYGRNIVLISCHDDVTEWLDPDWILDLNDQKYIDRRAFVGRVERREKLEFTIREVGRDTWKSFSKYHYLSENLPGGLVLYYGLFLGEKQIGFQCFAEYTPMRKGQKRILHINRTVIHPDYVGLGLGIRMVNSTSAIVKDKGYRVMAKYSSVPLFKAMIKHPALWRFIEKRNDIKVQKGGDMVRSTGFREKVTSYCFEFKGAAA